MIYLKKMTIQCDTITFVRCSNKVTMFKLLKVADFMARGVIFFKNLSTIRL